MPKLIKVTYKVHLNLSSSVIKRFIYFLKDSRALQQHFGSSGQWPDSSPGILATFDPSGQWPDSSSGILATFDPSGQWPDSSPFKSNSSGQCPDPSPN